MMPRLTTDCAKNYCNRTLIVKLIVQNVVTCFFGDTVYLTARQTARLYLTPHTAELTRSKTYHLMTEGKPH